MPLSAAEIRVHPAFHNVIWDLKPASEGKCTVARGRRRPVDIAYEIHGSGPVKIIWIMGLGAFKWYWQRQTQDFGHERGNRYSCLIFDNRGMGESDKPFMPYSTSEMAKDTLELLDHVGWVGKRSIHIVGISMGGCIAQEMAFLQPHRVASLSLISTAAELKNTIGYFENLRNRISIFIPKSIDAQIAAIKTRVSDAWLLSPDEEGEFPTNGDRFAAQELRKYSDTKGFTRRGFVCQAIAVGWHKKTAEQLKKIADEVGRERIQILHGTTDDLITFPHAEVLLEGLGGAERGVEMRVFEERGHYLPMEVREEFRVLIEGLLERTERIR